jgi:cellulose synthase/poly-beta-1,6-N-acetylglucosamine synthase-like glycosyltransferase
VRVARSEKAAIVRFIQNMWSTLIFGGTAAVFLAMTVATLWHLRWVRRLPALEELTTTSPERRIRCSVIIAARDEEARIEGTIRHLLAQRGVEAQFIVVDDRSTDRTSEILRRLAQEDARMEVKRVDVLPVGWLGKCHACHLGASTATSEWILFTDADCWLTSDLIARAVRVAEREGIDHITLTAGLSAKILGPMAAHLVYLMGTASWFSAANRDCPKSGLGFGAFNLVRTSAYRQCGGYEALRLTVLDDVKLGLLMRRSGKRTRGFIGGEDLECHWGSSAWSIVKIMEKNYFAALDYRTELVLAGSLAMILFSTILGLGLLSGTAAGLAAAFSPLTLIVPGLVLARRLKWSWPCALIIPLMFPVFHYALVNSAFRTLRQGGIRWRETFYSLETLRAGNLQ